MNRITYGIIIILLFAGCSVNQAGRNVHKRATSSINAYDQTVVKYKRPKEGLLKVHLAKPVVISVASRPEKWGFFQFPNIARNPDGTLHAKWNMATDAIESYGTHHHGSAVSADNGKTWKVQESAAAAGGLLLPNGDRIMVSTPKPIKAGELKLPKSIGSRAETYPRKAIYTFYKMDDLPESRQGIYLNRLRKGESEWKIEKAALYDPQAARYELSGLVPILWSGDMHVAPDGSIIAGVYPGFYIDEKGKVYPKDGVFFYRSTDSGHSWKIQGRILYTPDLKLDSFGDERMGFMEPAFEILADGTYLCVMRTSDGKGDGPMYISRSGDMGVTWSKPEVITAAGVLPQVLELENGVIALSAGRPGVQLRFSTDNGNSWTGPFEMMPYCEKQKNNISWYDHVSCGYTGLLTTGPDRFLIIYSDFKHLNERNELRNAIKVREVIVKTN